jgi:predicted molibdopterin-dependent oxidoreductase YjgC
LPTVGDSKEDWVIVAELAEAMGHSIVVSNEVSDIWDEIAMLTPNFVGVNYLRLEEPEAIQWPAPEPGHLGTKVMHKLEFSRGLGNFTAPKYVEPNEQATEQHPLILVTGRNLFHYNSGTQTRRTGLVDFSDEDILDMHPHDAKPLNINDGDVVILASPRNEVTIRVRVTEDVRQGNLFTTFHFPDIGVNSVLSSSADNLTQCPEYKVQAVSVRPLTSAV